MKRGLLLLFTLITPCALSAQWTVQTERLAGDDPSSRPVAMVTNASGYRLKVYRDPDDVVWALFELREGFDTMHTTSCPTYRVDRRRAVSLAADDERCRVEPRQAHYRLGTITDNGVSSPLLRHLMNGTEVVFRYHRVPRGYEETRFTLARSKHALVSALGSEVDVPPE